MKSNPIKEGSVTNDSRGVGTFTNAELQKRAEELAIIDGRTVQQVSPADWDRARRELTGEDPQDPQTAALESAPESKRWDPAPASPGRKARAHTSDDADADGQTDAERLTQEGLEEAEHERMLRATKETPNG